MKMDQPRIFCTILLVFLFLIISLSRWIDAASWDYPMANLSTSWINNNSYTVFLNEEPWQSTLTPILIRTSNGSQFICGFYCPKKVNFACAFGILIIPVPVSFEYAFHSLSLEGPKLIWSANRDHPVKINATLNFTQSGDMVLKDVDDTVVWSTNTGGKSVLGMNLTDMGNLVLFNKNNEIIWQSFNHPTDSLLPGQMLAPGQKLTCSASESNFSQGLLSLAFRGDSLLAYIESVPPQSYFEYDNWNTQYFELENGTLKSKKSRASVVQFTRLEFDGHFKAFQWGSSGWTVAKDFFSAEIKECGYPLVCGKYGICLNGQCNSIEETSLGDSIFKQISYRQPISCSHSEYLALLELNNTSYFKLNQGHKMVTTELYNDARKLEDCKNSCLRNCSCKAALFVYNSAMEGNLPWGCILLSEVFSLMDNEGGDDVSVFLKVENSPTAPYTSPVSPEKKSNHVRITLGSSLGAFFGVISLVCTLFVLSKRKNKPDESDEFFINHVLGMPTRFSFEELEVITSNFTYKLGEGGFGSVFKGILSDGTEVAVKRLDGLEHIRKSFLAEVETIGSIHHINLVRLIGYCIQKSHRLLVYEYMSNGSLDKWIFQRHQELTLGWQHRMNIIMDIAKGLAYLHEGCRKKIFHLDIKPQNILLHVDFTAKVSDFGLAKLIEKDQSQVMTTLRGTLGYLAPEWLSSIITEKVDVYSFGIVVLEILCGRKNLDRSQLEVDMHLLSLFKRKAEEGKLSDIVDRYNEDMQLHVAESVEMMKIALWCLQSDFSRRPSMSMVVKVLEGSESVTDDLNYNITIFDMPRTSVPIGPLGDALGDPTQLFPSALSGPR